MQTPLCIQSPIEWFNNEVIFITMTSINAEKALPTVYGKLLRNPAHWQILIAIVQFSNADKPRANHLIWTLSHFILMTCCVWQTTKKSCTMGNFFFQWSDYQEFFITKGFLLELRYCLEMSSFRVWSNFCQKRTKIVGFTSTPACTPIGHGNTYSPIFDRYIKPIPIREGPT